MFDAGMPGLQVSSSFVSCSISGVLQVEVEALKQEIAMLREAMRRFGEPAAQARRVVEAVTAAGCVLDTEGGLNSSYVVRGLSGELAEELGTPTQLLINFDSTLAQPVGGFVYRPCDDGAELLMAFAVPGRSLTACNLAGLKEFVKQSGGHTVRLESVKDAMPYWRNKSHFRGKGTRLKLSIAEE
ncbi:unnamed protein product, partial [Symbiodinium microadriaticum]